MTKSTEKKTKSPRVAHIDFNIDKEKEFVKYVKYLSNPWHIMWRNFLVGTFRGLGLVVGTAILLALIGFIVSKVLVEIPLFQNISEALDMWVGSTIDSQ